MQLTFILLTAAMLSVHASGVSQNITLAVKQTPLDKVFNQVEQKTNYVFFYKKELLRDAKPVTIEANNLPIDDFLTKVLEGQPLKFSIENNAVIISRRSGEKKSAVAMLSAINPPVTGIVRDADGNPLQGVNIVVKGTKRGVTSDASGNFSIEAGDNDILVISSIGFNAREIKITSVSVPLLVALDKSVSPLDEVQIVAYGTTSQRLNTGNVVSVKSKNIENQPINNVLYALQGQVPGMVVTPTSGVPGAPVNLQVRGNGSLLFKTEPLIVVDGLPIANNIPGLDFGGFAGNTLSNLNFLNPRDIESVEILKDADATSVYGSRGSNGVILITTKKGSIGETKISIDAQTGYAEVPREMKMLKTEEYLEMRKEAYANSNIDLSLVPADVSNADIKLWDASRYTNWQKELIGGTAQYQDIQASISGGVPTIQYLLSGNFHKETTVFPDDRGDHKVNVHASLTSRSKNQKFNATLTAGYVSDRNRLPTYDLTQNAIYLAPNAPAAFNEDGTLNWALLSAGNRSWDNPYASLFPEYDASIQNVLSSLLLSYKILPNLIVKLQAGINKLNGESYINSGTFRGRAPESANVSGSATFATNNSSAASVEPQANYDVNIGRQGRLSLLAGASYQESGTKNQAIFAEGFQSDALMRNLSSAASFRVSNTSGSYKYAAVFGRLGYNFDNTYLINVSVRRDGSSRFGPGNQFGNFGSVGAAWIFSENSFSKLYSPLLSYGKIRFSYGTTGSDAIGDYQYMERYEPIVVSDPYLGARSYASTGLFNAYYAWEETRKMEAGLELGFFKDRLLLTTSYFQNRSSNQLGGLPLPAMSGPGGAFVNLPAKVQNNGFELTLKTENIKTKNLTWTTSLNFTRNRNKLLSYPDVENSPYYKSIIGRPFYGEISVYQNAGVNSETGLYQFRTADGKTTSDPFDPDRADRGQFVRIFLEPKFYGGFMNELSYGRLNFGMLFQFTKQTVNSPFNSPFFALTGLAIKNVSAEFSNRWKAEGDISSFQKVYASFNLNAFRAANSFKSSDGNYVDGSYIKLKNLFVSYNFPFERKNKFVDNIKAFIQGQNLFVITKYKGLDPETKSTTNLPQLRVVTFGAQVNL